MLNNLFLVIALFSISSIAFIPAFAQETDTQTTPSLIDGISTSYLIAGVAIIGILLQTYKGMIGKSTKDFDIHQLIFTVIVGIGASVIVVGTAFQNIATDMNETELMIFMIQQVLTVMGAKTITDIGKKAISKNNTTKFDETTEPEPIDLEDDLPPGKDATEITT